MEFVIDAVDRDRSAGHEAISAIGNNRDRWSISAKSVMIRLSNRSARFFVVDQISGERAEIGLVREGDKAPYLRTAVGGKWTNHLLALPSPRNCKQID